MFLKSIIFFLIGYLITKLIFPKIYIMLIESNCIRPNYKKEMIPLCAGLIFIPTITILSLISFLIFNNDKYILILSFMVSVISMGLVGLIDDILGNKKVSGLKGHLLYLFNRGKLTTGAFKALYGGLVSLLISFLISSTIIDILINTIIIALFTNTINLLDLRPGRALKGYLFFSITLVLLYIDNPLNILLFGLIGSVSVYAPYDFQSKAMMGDTGSNVLGVSLGIICATSPSYIRIIYLIFLIIFHIYTEIYSLTTSIEKNKFLRYLDELGR